PTSSQMVFGSVFAALNALAAADIEPPRIAPNRKFRTKPSSRETIDPAAITTLARSSVELLEGAPWRRWRGTWWTRRAVLMSGPPRTVRRRGRGRLRGRGQGHGARPGPGWSVPCGPAPRDPRDR